METEPLTAQRLEEIGRRQAECLIQKGNVKLFANLSGEYFITRSDRTVLVSGDKTVITRKYNEL